MPEPVKVEIADTCQVCQMFTPGVCHPGNCALGLSKHDDYGKRIDYRTLIPGPNCRPGTHYLIPAPVAAAADAVVEAVENSEEEWGYQMPDVWEALTAYKEEATDAR